VNEHILLIEDNEQILRGNERMLARRGYDVASALTIAEAYAAISERMPDMIVLDIMLPDGNGIDFMRALRRDSDVPVLLLTGLSTPSDEMRGLTQGGDDYLAKPYDFGVLLARIEALLRRAGRVPKTMTKGALQFEILASRALLRGVDMLLTQKEFALLLLLAKNEGRVLSAEYLYETVWQQPMAADDSAIKTAVSRLRRKLGDGFSVRYDTAEDGYLFRSIPATTP
jgi:DNA-binding response OmpR family regulator